MLKGHPPLQWGIQAFNIMGSKFEKELNSSVPWCTKRQKGHLPTPASMTINFPGFQNLSIDQGPVSRGQKKRSGEEKEKFDTKRREKKKTPHETLEKKKKY